VIRKQRFVILIVLWLFTLSAAALVSAASEPLRHALVIGNGDYKAGPLKNPVNDSRDIRDLLRSIGFEVSHLENAGQRRMEDAIRTFGANLRRGGGVGFFYYAGHGMQVGGRNYLIPVGAQIISEHEMKYAAVDLGRVLDEVSRAENRANIIILDACRDNPFARSFRSSAKGLAEVGDTPTGTLIFYATAPGNTALDGEGRNSPYTKALLSHLPTPGRSILDICTRVNKDVKEATNKQQQPWMASSLSESVILVAGGSAFYTTDVPAVSAASPKTGSLVIETQPSGAAVSIAGHSRGRSPVTLKDLAPHRLKVRTELSGYEPAAKTVLIRAGRKSHLTLLLDKIITTGSLKITSDPVAAEWYLDGAYVGLTPDRLPEVEKGPHTVLVKKSGYRDWSQSASLASGREVSLVATLKKSPSSIIPLPRTKVTKPLAGAREKALYDEALSTFKHGNYKAAKDKFKKFIATFPDSTYKVNAIFWVGECFYKAKDYAEAIIKYEEIIIDHPLHPKAPGALLKQGFAFFKRGETTEGIIVLEKVIAKYPGSDFAKIARRKLKILE